MDWLDVAYALQVMQTKNMLYLVSEYAPHGEIFGMYSLPIV